MIRERVLEVDLAEAILLFEHHKWKFFESNSETGIVKIEIPKGETEIYVVEFPFTNQNQLKALISELSKAGFIKQTIRTKGSF